MRCRQIKDNEIVWFDSLGLDYSKPVYDDTGKLLGYKALRADSFVDKQQSVVSSLTQRLSVIQTELWYKINYGLPLFNKTKSKPIVDSTVLSIISSHQDVVQIKSFKSSITDKSYTCNIVIGTKYGDVNIQI